jgi:hypothetical protein
LATYRSIRNPPPSQIRPLPNSTSHALTILFFSGLIALASTLPVCAPPNIFRQTGSRLQTPAGVLLTRLAALRPLTPSDETLRQVLDVGGLDARLLYARYGPAVLTTCTFAKPGDGDAKLLYLLYALPSLLTPHLLHLFALGIATSRSLSGKTSARWRTIASISGLVLAAAEVYFIANYDDTPNQRSTRVSEIDFIHWKLRVYRGLCIATIDGLLGWVIYLQSTGRAFLSPPPASERLLDHAKTLEGLLTKTRSLGVLRNGTVRDASARGKANEYWVKEGEVMRDVLEEPEVLEAQRRALGRADVGRMGREAAGYVDSVFAGIEVAVQPSNPG